MSYCCASVIAKVFNGLIGSFIGCAISSIHLLAYAQITPDDSLGAEKSTLLPTNVLDGGARRGANLFHSFSQFNVGEGQRIDFANPVGVDRIFTRVTGRTRSDILGTLGVLGSADLFLINPNGILFGPNAQLDLRGSFVASTANGLLFDNGFVFSTANPTSPPLLTIRVPVGLQYTRATGAIAVQGASLVVPPGKTLALVGGDVRLQDNAVLQIPDAYLELGGLSGAGVIGLQPTNTGLQLQFPEGVARSQVDLSSGALVFATSDNNGGVTVNAKTLQVSAGAQLVVLTPGNQNATRETRIDATDAVLITGENSGVVSLVTNGSNGNGAPLSLRTRALTLSNGGQLGAITLGAGKAGDVNIAASESVTLVGTGPNNPDVLTALASQSAGSGSGGNVAIVTNQFILDQEAQVGALAFGSGKGGNVSIDATDVAIQNGGFLASVVGTDASGNGGNLRITTRTLRVANTGQLGTNTDGPGLGGQLTITATESIVFDGIGVREAGTGAFSRSGSGFLSRGLQAGRGGTIDVKTPSLLITNGANVDASAFKNGEGGSVAVTVQNLSVLNGGQIGARTVGLANAGTVEIVATNTAIFDGVLAGQPSGAFTTVETGAIGNGGLLSLSAGTLLMSNGARLSTATSGRGSAGTLTVNVTDAVLTGSGTEATEILSRVNAGAVGEGGNIFVNAARLRLQQNAQIAANSEGDGRAGNIQMRGNTLSLDRGARISAETASNQGGNITLDLRDLLLLRRGSQISTTAGTAQAGGDGGNITINLSKGFIVAVLAENSDIRANAFTGRGGNINITAQGIYGIQFQPFDTPNSDITASSQFGLSGIVTLNTLSIDPARGTVTLPTNFSTPPLAEGCAAPNSQTSRFVSTGRGGVSANPVAPLTADTIWQDLGLGLVSDTGDAEPQASSSLETASTEIVEAQAWEATPDGAIALTAQAPRGLTPNCTQFHLMRR